MIKRVAVAASMAVLLALTGYAAGAHHPAFGETQAESRVLMSDGEVKKVDVAAGRVTVKHGPLENLGMPGMTMVFKVKDAAWLEQMRAGDKIHFLADRVNGAFTIVVYEPVR